MKQMWLSKRLRAQTARSDVAAEMGVTTIGGAHSGVYARGEVRDLPVCAPGGMVWRPRCGDRVVVLKGGPGGEEACVLGVSDAEEETLADGELYLTSAGGASSRLCNDGTIELTGTLRINGDLYHPCQCKPQSITS